MLLALIVTILVYDRGRTLNALTIDGVEAKERIILLPPVKATIRADFLVVGTKDSIVDLDGRWGGLDFGHRTT